jgi:beta-galactosidase
MFPASKPNSPVERRKRKRAFKASYVQRVGPASSRANCRHPHSIGGKSYGFDYDDVNNQSSSIVSLNPKQMVVRVSWN